MNLLKYRRHLRIINDGLTKNRYIWFSTWNKGVVL